MKPPRSLLIGTMLALAATGAAAGDSWIGVGVSINREPNDFNLPKSTEFGIEGAHTFDNQVIVEGKFEIQEDAGSHATSENLEGTVGYKLRFNDAFSLTGRGGIGENFQSASAGGDFPFYVFYLAADLDLTRRVTWNVITFRYRNAFDPARRLRHAANRDGAALRGRPAQLDFDQALAELEGRRARRYRGRPRLQIRLLIRAISRGAIAACTSLSCWSLVSAAAFIAASLASATSSSASWTPCASIPGSTSASGIACSARMVRPLTLTSAKPPRTKMRSTPVPPASPRPRPAERRHERRVALEHREIALGAGHDDLVDRLRHEEPLGRNQLELEGISHRRLTPPGRS